MGSVLSAEWAQYFAPLCDILTLVREIRNGGRVQPAMLAGP